MLKAVRTGFLETQHGQLTPGSGRPGTAITRAAGQRIESITMTMPRGGVISGIVLDEVGDPAPGVPMRAMRYVWRNGVRELATGSGATTDDRGHYRIAMLIPGEYVVCAMPRDEIVLAVTQYDELRNRGQQVLAAQAARLGADSAEARAMAARAAAAQGPPPAQPKEAYVPVCFPSTRQMMAAATLTVGVGEERGGTDLRLQIEPIAKVSGTVSWSGGTIPIGNTASDTTIWLVDKSSVPGGVTDRVVHATANGEFAFPNVAPGEYTLRANATVPQRGPSTGTATADARTPATPTMELAAVADIVVTGQPLADVRLALERGATIVGRIVGEGVPAAELSRIRITASPAGSFVGEMAPAIGIPDTEGRFTLVGIVPGRFRITSYGALPGGAAIKSSVFGAQGHPRCPARDPARRTRSGRSRDRRPAPGGDRWSGAVRIGTARVRPHRRRVHCRHTLLDAAVSSHSGGQAGDRRHVQREEPSSWRIPPCGCRRYRVGAVVRPGVPAPTGRGIRVSHRGRGRASRTESASAVEGSDGASKNQPLESPSEVIRRLCVNVNYHPYSGESSPHSPRRLLMLRSFVVPLVSFIVAMVVAIPGLIAQAVRLSPTPAQVAATARPATPTDEEALNAALQLSDPAATLAALEKVRVDFPTSALLRTVDLQILRVLVANFPTRTDAMERALDRIVASVAPDAPPETRFTSIVGTVSQLIARRLLLDRAENLLTDVYRALDFDKYAQAQRAATIAAKLPVPDDAALRRQFNTSYMIRGLEEFGRLSLARGDAAGAESRLNEALALRDPAAATPSLANAVVELAEVYENRGDAQKAEHLLQAAHTAAPSLRPIILGLAEFWSRHDKTVQAEKILKDTIASVPNFPRGQVMLAGLEARRGDHVAALDRYMQASLAGSVRGADHEAMVALYAKVHGSATGFEPALDRLYREKFPNPVKPSAWTKTSARSARVVLLEMFTGSGCPPCVAADLALDGLIDRYPAEAIVSLAYHVHFPQPDPMTTSDSKTRAEFYKVTGVPAFFIDGALVAGADGRNLGGGARAYAPSLFDIYVPKVDKALETDSSADVAVRATVANEQVTVVADVTKLPAGAKDLRLHLVLAERELKFIGENGIRFHPMVVRDVAGENAAGLPLASTGAQRFTFDLAAIRADVAKNLDDELADRRRNRAPNAAGLGWAAEGRAMTTIDPSHLVVVAYIQDAAKRVLQAARADVVVPIQGR